MTSQEGELWLREWARSFTKPGRGLTTKVQIEDTTGEDFRIFEKSSVACSSTSCTRPSWTALGGAIRFHPFSLSRQAASSCAF